MLSFTSCLTKKSPRLPGEFKNLSNDNVTNLKFDIVFYQNLTKSLQDQTKITNFLRTFVMSRATWLSNVYLVELAIHNWQNFFNLFIYLFDLSPEALVFLQTQMKACTVVQFWLNHCRIRLVWWRKLPISWGLSGWAGQSGCQMSTLWQIW